MRQSREFNKRAVALLFLWVALCLAAPAEPASAGQTAPASAEGMAWFLDMKQYAASAHSSLTCRQCHPQLYEADRLHPDARQPSFLQANALRSYDYGLCNPCHRSAFSRYQTGAHAKALKKEMALPASGKTPSPGQNLAPVCGDCHSAHYEPSHRSRIDTGRNMMGVCGSCHPAQLATYLDNYHGKAAVNLGREDSAFCTDCHGAHQTRSLKDRQAALTACQRCHPQAGNKFAEFVIHPTSKDLDPKDADIRFRVTVIKIVSILAAVLVALLVALYYSHTFLWILREIHEKLRKHLK